MSTTSPVLHALAQPGSVLLSAFQIENITHYIARIFWVQVINRPIHMLASVLPIELS